MAVIRAKHALLPTGWADDVRVTISDDGRIKAVDEGQGGAARRDGDHVAGILLAAPVNVHSHAFQRALAGMTEGRGPDPADSFWTWRQLMYRFLGHLTPAHVHAITAFAQMEMLEAGYAAVAEFHYLHHQPRGMTYANPGEMAQRIIAAAADTGIGLTLLPVLYEQGGCDGRPLSDAQLRFRHDIDSYQRLFESAGQALVRLPADAYLGVAAHSLRAVTPASLTALAAMADGKPIHMHLAEQIAEVEEVKSAWGKRPVEWLLDTAAVDRNWCLVHSTQMQPHETRGLARTGAVAGLCPITEASLGDGIFDGVRWLAEGGQIAIGTDSNIRISLAEELRMLEYSQRLQHKARAVLATDDKSTGRRLFDAVNAGGARAGGRNSGAIAPGAWADLLALDQDAVDLSGRAGDTLIDAFVFSGGDDLVTDVWSAGRHMVKDGRHKHRSRIESRYRKVMADLGEQM